MGGGGGPRLANGPGNHKTSARHCLHLTFAGAHGASMGCPACCYDVHSLTATAFYNTINLLRFNR